MGKRKKIVAGTTLLVLAAGMVTGYVVINRMNQPVTAEVTAGPSKVNFDYSIDMTPQTQAGQYASFDYPKGLKLQPAETIKPPTLQQFNFIGHDVKAWILATSVATLPAGDVSNNSSFTLRKNNPKQYLESTVQLHGQSIVVFTDTQSGSFSKVAFIPHAGQVGIVSLTGDDIDGANPLDTAFTMTLQSWQWK